MKKHAPEIINPMCIPDCDKYPDAENDLTDELTQRALRIHDQSFKGGSFSSFYDSITQEFIAVSAERIVDISVLHGRPEAKIARAAAKALDALQVAITEREEELK